MNKFASSGQFILRMALSAGFIFPVLDRLGFLGKSGDVGVAWGDWKTFTHYTHTLAPYLSESIAWLPAGVATALEIIFGICLLLGWKTRKMAAGSALLTAVFGLSMALFVSPLAPVNYPVFVFTGGALLLAALTDFPISIDDMNRKA